MSYLISVIIPVYNGEKYIKNLMLSLLNQDILFENLEIIFVDNMSTDNSVEFLKKYSEEYKNIKIITCTTHTNTPGRSRNIGIKKSTSENIIFLDQDDTITNDFCKVMYNKITTKNVDFVSSRYTVVDGNKKYLNKSFLEKYESSIEINDIKEYLDVIKTQANLTVWNKIYSRDFIISNNIEFVENHWSEDYLFSLEVYLKAKKILLLNKYSGYLYFLNNDSASHKKVSKKDIQYNCLIPLEKAKKLLIKYNIEYIPVVSEFLVLWTKIVLQSNLNTNDFDEIYESFKKWFGEYKINNRLVNIPIYLNLFINIFIKLFYLSKTIFLLTNKIVSKFN